METKTKETKVLIALPCTDDVKAKTALCLAGMCLFKPTYPPYYEADILMRIGCDIVGSRIFLVNQARELGMTHILFLDHDMWFPPNSIEQLLIWDKDIIGAAYNYRSFPLKSTAFPLGTEPINGEYFSDPKKLPTELFKCDVIATGLLLIKLSVFDKLEKPWFQFGRKDDGELNYGEDTYFCRRAIEAGFDIWCDPTLTVRHLGVFPF